MNSAMTTQTIFESRPQPHPDRTATALRVDRHHQLGVNARRTGSGIRFEYPIVAHAFIRHP
jgi:hypothetical protein